MVKGRWRPKNEDIIWRCFRDMGDTWRYCTGHVTSLYSQLIHCNNACRRSASLSGLVNSNLLVAAGCSRPRPWPWQRELLTSTSKTTHWQNPKKNRTKESLAVSVLPLPRPELSPCWSESLWQTTDFPCWFNLHRVAKAWQSMAKSKFQVLAHRCILMHPDASCGLVDIAKTHHKFCPFNVWHHNSKQTCWSTNAIGLNTVHVLTH